MSENTVRHDAQSTRLVYVRQLQNQYKNCERRLRGTVLYSKPKCSHLHKLTEAYVNFNGKYFREHTFPPEGENELPVNGIELFLH